VELLADPRRHCHFEAIIALNFDNNNPIAAANTIVVTLKPFTVTIEYATDIDMGCGATLWMARPLNIAVQITGSRRMG
jgi:hypothetical protein